MAQLWPTSVFLQTGVEYPTSENILETGSTYFCSRVRLEIIWRRGGEHFVEGDLRTPLDSLQQNSKFDPDPLASPPPRPWPPRRSPTPLGSSLSSPRSPNAAERPPRAAEGDVFCLCCCC